MKVSTEQVPGSQIALEIEVDAERVEKAKTSAYRRLASKAKIPGFRPGKAPRDVIERHFGEHAILHEAIDRLMPQVYKEALEQEKIEPIDQAGYELVTEEPLVAKFTVPVRPTVDIGDYTTLRVPREPIDVPPERVQEGIESLQHRYATLEPVSRPIAWNDIVRADVDATVEGAPLVHEEDAEFQILEERPISLPGFTEALIGKEKGASFEVDVTVPDDAPDENMRGKQAHYKVAVKEVKLEVLPELDDDFARLAGEGFESMTALRARVEEDLREAVEREDDHRYRDAVMEQLVERVQPEFPPILAEREADRMLQEQASQMQPQNARAGGREGLERFLKQVGKTEDEVRDELRPIAEARISRSLVLSAVTEAEHIAVTDAELEEEIERLSSGAGEQAEEIRRLFSSDASKENLRHSQVTKRTLERLMEIASGEDQASSEYETSSEDETSSDEPSSQDAAPPTEPEESVTRNG